VPGLVVSRYSAARVKTCGANQSSSDLRYAVLAKYRWKYCMPPIGEYALALAPGEQRRSGHPGTRDLQELSSC
jgi:hypothetical protein